jgi:hypothetical protein
MRDPGTFAHEARFVIVHFSSLPGSCARSHAARSKQTFAEKRVPIRQFLPSQPRQHGCWTPPAKAPQLDRLYQRAVNDLDALVGGWASRRRDTGAKREQNPHHGAKRSSSKSDTHLAGRRPLSFICFNSMRDLRTRSCTRRRSSTAWRVNWPILSAF